MFQRRKSDIDYVLNLVDVEWYFYVLSAGLFVIIGLIWKKWRIAILAAYVFFILSLTILSRKPFHGNHVMLQPLWSWNVPRLREQIIMNIIGFIPVGFIGASLWNWRIIPTATGISLTIETIQLITETGLFEIDDILHNTLGAVIGFVLFILLTKLIEKKAIADGKETA